VRSDYLERGICVVTAVSDVSCTDPMPIYAQLTKGRNLFVGKSSSHVQDESSMDGAPTRRSGDSKVTCHLIVCGLLDRTINY